MTETPPRVSLRDLPLAARLTLSAFLISTGIGYASALIQLHFQHAAPGTMLPSGKDAVRVYHGEKPPRPIDRGRDQLQLLVERSIGKEDQVAENTRLFAGKPGLLERLESAVVALTRLGGP